MNFFFVEVAGSMLTSEVCSARLKPARTMKEEAADVSLFRNAPEFYMVGVVLAIKNVISGCATRNVWIPYSQLYV